MKRQAQKRTPKGLFGWPVRRDMLDPAGRWRNGWAGGRERHCAWRWIYRLCRHGEWVGCITRYDHDAPWLAERADGESKGGFWHRRDAKRWVEQCGPHTRPLWIPVPT